MLEALEAPLADSRAAAVNIRLISCIGRQAKIGFCLQTRNSFNLLWPSHGFLVLLHNLKWLHIQDGCCHQGEVPDGTWPVGLLHALELDEARQHLLQALAVSLQEVLSLGAESQALNGIAILEDGLTESKNNLQNNKHFEPVLVCCGFFLTIR